MKARPVEGFCPGAEGQKLAPVSHGPLTSWPGLGHTRGSGASVLIGVLWCLALLSIIVFGVLHTARMDLMVMKNYGDRVQAHYLALAGIEKAKALLYQDARQRSRSRVNHDGTLYNAPEQFRGVSLGRGQFSVFRRGRMDEGGGIIYGISDEESRLNVNTASAQELAKIQDMTPDVVAAIIDWRDSDNAVSQDGAESDFYLSLRPPYVARNGPLQTLRELLMVRGITAALLLGRESVRGGRADPFQEGGDQGASDSPDRGWAPLLTVDSAIDNVNAAGEERVNIQSADEAALSAVNGITPGIAKAIVAYRGQHQFQSLADLLDVVAVQNRPGQNGQPNQGRENQARNPNLPGGPNNPNSNPSGPKVISEDLLTQIADDLTVNSSDRLQGLIDINTAGLEVLRCLPGLDRQLAQAIISYRASSGFFPNTACLLKVPGLTPAIYKQVASIVCVRSETYRILSQGKVSSSGARERIQEIVHVGLQDVTTLSYREDDL
jgi:DNA uptake protein ComE-like DNA-binding protein